MDKRMSKDEEIENGNEGKSLWKIVTRDIKKLGHKEKASTVPPPARVRVKEHIPIIPLTGLELPKGGGIDRKTEDRVRKGEMQIDARLDLHGHTLGSARQKLLHFVAQSFSSNKRALLVITGKGRAPDTTWHDPGMGAIKREFRLWLEDPSVKPYILSVSEAQPKHGGSGAYYIYLRKRK